MNIENITFAKRRTNNLQYINSTKVLFPPRVCPRDVSLTAWQEADMTRVVNSWEERGLVC